jgi:hypothetical protein
MAEINHAHETFINEMIAHGKRQEAYLAAYPGSNYNSAASAAWRLMANPAIATRIQEGILAARMQAIQTHKQIYQGQLADKEEKRKVLAQIIRGELQTENEVLKYGRKQKIKQGPKTTERLKAIALDNQMEEYWNTGIF